MYTVLIVDDEMLVSIGLRNMIDWGKMGMRVVAEAQNGAAALEIYEKEKPDLILTDIKMPVMDGLQLISKIREKDKKTKIIILTCYQEFDMVHQALKLGVSDYILKLKMSTDEMETVIKRVHAELGSENLHNIEEKDSLADSRYLKGKIIRDYVIYKNCSAAEFEKMVSGYQMRLKATGLVLCLMKTLNRRHDDADQGHAKSVGDTILNMIDELLCKYKRGEIVYKRDREYLVLFSFADIISENDARMLLYEILDRIRTIMKTYINSGVIFGISSRSDGYGALDSLLTEADEALKQGFYTRGSWHIQYGDDSGRNTFMSLVAGFREEIDRMQDINNEYRKEIMSGIIQLEGLFRAPEDEIQELFIRWIHLAAVNSNISGVDISSLALEYAGKVRCCSTMAEAMEVFKKYLLSVAKSQADVKLVSREISEAVGYIRNNYHLDISLQQVAGIVEISTNYLSSMFGKELNISFIDYVNQVRIDKAKELLLSTHLKTYEIARQVGFSDESYFSRIFKRITGLRPNEFKKHNAVSVEGFFGKDKVW